MRINHNIPALNTYNQYSKNIVNSSKSMEKLSSGLRINRAADDAAGLSISEKMRSQIKGLTQAVRNAQDGVSFIQTAEGALSEVSDMLVRVKELSVQVQNGTYDIADQNNIGLEMKALGTAVNDILTKTTFNSINVFTDGATITYGESGAQSVVIGSAPATVVDSSTNTLKGLTDAAVGIAAATGTMLSDITDAATAVTTATTVATTGTVDTAAALGTASVAVSSAIDAAAAAAAATAAKTDVTNATSSLTGLTDASAALALKATAAGVSGITSVVTATTAASDAAAAATTALGAATTALTALEGADAGTYIALKATAVTAVDAAATALTTAANAATAAATAVSTAASTGTVAAPKNVTVASVESAISEINTQRATYGAQQNQLEHVVNNLGTTGENIQAAESRIRDVDMAKEMSEFTKANILVQAAQAMLAQANAQPRGVIQLLQA